MKWDVLRLDILPRPPPRPRAVAVAALIGVATGLISSLPSPLPDVRLQNPDVLINAEGVPLHAGIAFGAGVGLISWLWAKRDPGKCLLAMALTLMGWLAAVNTANDAMQAVVGSELFGTVEGAKASREVVGWVLGGLFGGAVGAGLTAFGAGVPGEAIRRPQAWGLIVVTGTLFGLLLYPAALADLVALLFVPWQAAVLAAIAYGLSRRS
ncbi:hypothetical protein [Methyloceanibacter sp.]|uniref:hypothetical protein n=1 Tax=Methyloceanibacter sp. TaxID=1965321 RepID=UPI002D4FF09A|nr:hypothetical protein [Methyloceanibacter sp.]HZP08835.1 hypothetical protein [Methyloceanibacter sp.]